MAIRAVQKNESQNKMSYLNSVVAGGIAGYAVKWALPLVKSEKDDSYKNELLQIRRNSRQVRLDEITAIEKEASNLPGVDEFIKLHKEDKLFSYEIEKLSSPIKENVLGLFTRINSAASEARTNGKKVLALKIKALRPTGTFVTLGCLTGFVVAFIKNITPKEKKYIDDLDSESLSM